VEGLRKGGNGEHKGELDLKKGGIFPITYEVRCLSLFNGILKRNTYDRTRVLMGRGILRKNFGRDLLEA